MLFCSGEFLLSHHCGENLKRQEEKVKVNSVTIKKRNVKIMGLDGIFRKQDEKCPLAINQPHMQIGGEM